MDDLDRYRVAPGGSLRLADHQPDDRTLFDGLDKEDGRAELLRINERLTELQVLLAAEGKHRLLIVLQAMDTGGKDGTIRNVFHGVNPQGVYVAPFKQPTDEELAHDFLWRVHRHVPGNGQIAVFNRSHYEDVLIVRVHDLVPEERWRRRYDHITRFERLLVDEGTTVVKLFLHISKDEQRQRLQARLDDPQKRWKFHAGDLAERLRWDDHMAAFEEAIAETSTEVAPWWIVPADRKWYRDLVVSSILVRALEGLDMQWPDPPDLDGIVVV